jgi:hypothetical protein
VEKERGRVTHLGGVAVLGNCRGEEGGDKEGQYGHTNEHLRFLIDRASKLVGPLLSGTRECAVSPDATYGATRSAIAVFARKKPR